MLAAAAVASLNGRSRRATSESVVVAVKVERIVSKDSLAWALSHVVHAGDSVTLLAVFPGEKSGRRFWNISMLTGNCASSHMESLPDRILEITESCSQMLLQFHNQDEVKVRFKVVSGTPGNAVAEEASRNRASWVILDKKLRLELKHCIEDLRCNIVVMNRSQATVIRLNLQQENDIGTYFSAAASPVRDIGELWGQKMKHCTPVSSPEEPNTSYSRTTRGDSVSSSDTIVSPFLLYEHNPLFEGVNRENYASMDYQVDVNYPSAAPDTRGKKLHSLSTPPASSAAHSNKSVFWIPQNHLFEGKPIAVHSPGKKNRSATSKTLLDKFMQHDTGMKANHYKPELSQNHHNFVAESGIRNAVPMNRISSTSPPLCSLCQNKAPVFGKPPKQFSYQEIEEATDGFSDINFLAEGGFGIVYRGVLRDGQVVAVKLLKFAGSQADTDFYREVRVLSCAQHRNVVLLIGFCIDGKRRVLLYEYICNGSLDFHLHENMQKPLDWDSRLRIAIGTARGLRYLHEDCRVGCIVHRDMRPHNILLTHDFEPLVADFGLARWYSECTAGTEERVIGTSGYLAPEYVDGGIISQKVDVYAFGLVLLELITGRRASELQYLREHNFLSELLQPPNSLEPNRVLEKLYQLLDPSLVSDPVDNITCQLNAITFAASLCLTRDPESRPLMSKVLRILEGGIMSFPQSFDLNSVGNRSGHLLGLASEGRAEFRRSHSRRLSH